MNLKNNQFQNYNNNIIISNNNSNINNYMNNIIFSKNNSIFGNQNNYNIMNNNNNIINQNYYQININNINQSFGNNNFQNNDIIKEDNKNNLNLNNKIHNDINNSPDKASKEEFLYLLDNIKSISENQSGCRLLQFKLGIYSNGANEFYKALEKNKILKKMVLDNFGNYFIQKLLDYITHDLITEFCLNIIFPFFPEISLNPHGSRVIQKLLERIYNDQNLMMPFNVCLQKSMMNIFPNQTSTHIIIKYISLINYPNNQIIYTFINQNIFFISTHKHSCCTLQKCLEKGNDSQREEILLSLAQISNHLFADLFGNYAIQYALSLKNEKANKIIISQYLYNFKQNISNKISSNVYEKVLEFSDFNTKQNIIQYLCNFDRVKELLYDTYGNYVLQKTIMASSEPFRSKYLEFIVPLLDGLKNLPNGLIVFHKLIVHFPELQNYINLNKNFHPKMNINNQQNINNYGINNFSNNSNISNEINYNYYHYKNYNES